MLKFRRVGGKWRAEGVFLGDHNVTSLCFYFFSGRTL